MHASSYILYSKVTVITVSVGNSIHPPMSLFDFKDPNRSPDGFIQNGLFFSGKCCRSSRTAFNYRYSNDTIQSNTGGSHCESEVKRLPIKGLFGAEGRRIQHTFGFCPRGNFGCQNIRVEIRQIRVPFLLEELTGVQCSCHEAQI